MHCKKCGFINAPQTAVCVICKENLYPEYENQPLNLPVDTNMPAESICCRTSNKSRVFLTLVVIFDLLVVLGIFRGNTFRTVIRVVNIPFNIPKWRTGRFRFSFFAHSMELLDRR